MIVRDDTHVGALEDDFVAELLDGHYDEDGLTVEYDVCCDMSTSENDGVR